jgi:hypothetical protein
LAAFSAPAIFALEWPSGDADWLIVPTAALVVIGALVWALTIQRWRAPMIAAPDGPRRGSDPWPAGPWQTTALVDGVLSRARIWGAVTGLGCLLVAALNAAGMISGSSFARIAHAVSLLGALIVAGFAFRSRVVDEGGSITDYGTLGDFPVRCRRWREVVVSRVGPFAVWAPQLDDDSPRGFVVGKCARIAWEANARDQEEPPTR